MKITYSDNSRHCALCNTSKRGHMLEVSKVTKRHSGVICANCAGDILDALPAFARVSSIVTDAIVTNAHALLESVDIVYDRLMRVRSK